MQRVSMQLMMKAGDRRRHRHHGHRRRRWSAAGLLAVMIVAAVPLVYFGWASAFAARVQLRMHQTIRELPHEAASVALPPLCFLVALAIAIAAGIAILRMGRFKGFVFAGINTAVVFLLWAWALSGSQEWLQGTELQEVRLGDVLYVLSFFTVVLVPFSSYFAWIRASVR